jgi:hypothetical protein
MSDRDIYLVIRRAVRAILGAFDKKYNVQPTEK